MNALPAYLTQAGAVAPIPRIAYISSIAKYVLGADTEWESIYGQ